MCVAFLPSKADEGMWLLQLMQEQHLADRMKAQGLLLEADDIYNPEPRFIKRCSRHFSEEDVPVKSSHRTD